MEKEFNTVFILLNNYELITNYDGGEVIHRYVGSRCRSVCVLHVTHFTHMPTTPIAACTRLLAVTGVPLWGPWPLVLYYTHMCERMHERGWHDTME